MNTYTAATTALQGKRSLANLSNVAQTWSNSIPQELPAMPDMSEKWASLKKAVWSGAAAAQESGRTAMSRGESSSSIGTTSSNGTGRETWGEGFWGRIYQTVEQGSSKVQARFLASDSGYGAHTLPFDALS